MIKATKGRLNWGYLSVTKLISQPLCFSPVIFFFHLPPGFRWVFTSEKLSKERHSVVLAPGNNSERGVYTRICLETHPTHNCGPQGAKGRRICEYMFKQWQVLKGRLWRNNGLCFHNNGRSAMHILGLYKLAKRNTEQNGTEKKIKKNTLEKPDNSAGIWVEVLDVRSWTKENKKVSFSYNWISMNAQNGELSEGRHWFWTCAIEACFYSCLGLEQRLTLTLVLVGWISMALSFCQTFDR